MQTSELFSYNLPCIPGKPIRLRVQSVPKKGFMSLQPKVTQKYNQLTDSFISQYSNLKPRSNKSFSAKEDLSTRAPNTKRQQPQSWYIVPQHKGGLMKLYEETDKNINKQYKNNNYLLRKRQNLSKNLYAKFIKEKNQQKSILQQMLKDEHHKMWQQQAKKKQNKKKKPSPCFVGVTRNKINKNKNIKQDEDNQQQVIEDILFIEDCSRYQQSQESSPFFKPQQPAIKIEQLRQQTKKFLQKIEPKKILKVLNQQQQLIEEQQQKIPSHMFIKDDRDRFGQYIFPIVAKLNVPGPGAYKQKNTMQNKAKKIRLLQQQRKILKQWFND